jgi:hypothetical protein
MDIRESSSEAGSCGRTGMKRMRIGRDREKESENGESLRQSL